MADKTIFPHQPQCMWLEEARVIALWTRNTSGSLDKSFTSINLVTLKTPMVLSELGKDLVESSPTPGFTLELEAKIFGTPIGMVLGLKMFNLFGPPRTTSRYISHVGIHGMVWDERDHRRKPLLLSAHLQLEDGGDTRWSLTDCYLHSTEE